MKAEAICVKFLFLSEDGMSIYLFGKVPPSLLSKTVFANVSVSLFARGLLIYVVGLVLL